MSSPYYITYGGNRLAFPGATGSVAWEDVLTVYNLSLASVSNGAISADKLSGYDGDVVTLENTASAGYTFNGYSVTGASLTGNQFVFSGSDVTASAAFKQNMTTAWIVGSPSAHAYGYAYDGSTLLTSWNTTGSASAEIPINCTFKISSVANTYIRNGIAAPTGLSSTAYAATKTRYQTASGKTTGGSAVLSVNSVQKAAFTAYGTFPSGANTSEARNRFGHWMPHQVTSVSPSTFINAGDVSAKYSAEYRILDGSTWSTSKTGSMARLKTGINFSGISAHALATARKNSTYVYNQFNLFISNKTSKTVNQASAGTSTPLTLNVAYNAAAVKGTTAIGTNPISLRNSSENGDAYAWWEAAKFTATGMVP